MGLLVAAMAGHYYKDDISAEQMAMKTIDFCMDLGEFTVTEIQSAFTNYRQDDKNKIFPRPGRIRELCFQERADRQRMSRAPIRGGGRPYYWWDRPKTHWDADWYESEVPTGKKIRDTAGGPLRDPI